MSKTVGYQPKYEWVKGKRKKIINAHYYEKKHDEDSFKLSGLYIAESFSPESENNVEITRIG